jgi:hypothetical protein
MRFARDAAVVLLVVLAQPVVTVATTVERAAWQPLCQECAKTGKHSPTIRGTEWTRTSR